MIACRLVEAVLCKEGSLSGECLPVILDWVLAVWRQSADIVEDAPYAYRQKRQRSISESSDTKQMLATFPDYSLQVPTAILPLNSASIPCSASFFVVVEHLLLLKICTFSEFAFYKTSILVFQFKHQQVHGLCGVVMDSDFGLCETWVQIPLEHSVFLHYKLIFW